MWEFFNKRTIVSRRAFRCSECALLMPAGTRQVYCSGKVDGDFTSYRLCEDCDLISTEWCFAFDDGEGWPMGDLRQSMIDDDIADPLAWATERRAARDAAAARVASRTHELKVWPGFYDLVASGKKPFEVRLNDRGYLRGDQLVLREYDPEAGAFTGRQVQRRVTCVLENAEMFGVMPGYCVLGLGQ